MSNSRQICAHFSALSEEGQKDFSLMLTHKGVPVVEPSCLVKVEPERAWFTATPTGLALMQHNYQVFILSEGLLDPIEGETAVLNLEEGAVCLENFHFAGMRFANRHELRVEPDSPLPVLVEAGNIRLMAEIIDISLRGLGARLAIRQIPPEFNAACPAVVTLILPEGEIHLEGKVRNARSSQLGVRLAVEFTGAETDKALLVRYIMHRRSQIMAEIHQMEKNLLKR